MFCTKAPSTFTMSTFSALKLRREVCPAPKSSIAKRTPAARKSAKFSTIASTSWIAAVSMSVLYSVVGSAAPLVILISFLFPMLVLALCLVYLTRQAPSAGGIFILTLSTRNSAASAP